MSDIEKERSKWTTEVSKKGKITFVEGNTRLRKEYLTYAIDENDMVVGYFVPSLSVGVVFVEPVEKNPYVKYRKEEDLWPKTKIW